MLRNRESIAGAVAREIDRIHQTGDAIAEGAAYKAAFDRAGSSWEKHCHAVYRDALIFEAGRCGHQHGIPVKLLVVGLVAAFA